MEKARESYDEVQLFVFSDHGMANCDEVLDLQSVLAKLPLKFGRDYTAVFDSGSSVKKWKNERGERKNERGERREENEGNSGP